MTRRGCNIPDLAIAAAVEDRRSTVLRCEEDVDGITAGLRRVGGACRLGGLAPSQPRRFPTCHLWQIPQT